MPDLTHAPSPPGPDQLLRLDQQLCFALYASSLAMTKLYKPLLAPLGLTYPQYLVMLVLWEQDDRAVHELGELLQLDSGTLTPLLKRLEASGLISRQRDQADERRVRIRLTDAGQRLKQAASSIPVSVMCQVGGELDAMVELRQRLHALRQSLQGQPQAN
jgi:MarR family transcriptional regulator, organic hydroperoxide resistance regulator